MLPALEPIDHPIRVLDIGSGTDATALALTATFPGQCFEIDAIEPSREMAAAGRTLTASLDIAIDHIRGTFDDVLSGTILTSKQYDLVVVSALLPYGWEIGGTTNKVAFGDFLERRLVPGGRVIVIEPRAKARELAVFATTLERTNILAKTHHLNANGPPPALPECTGLLARWQAMRGFRIAIQLGTEELVASAMRNGQSVQLADVALVGERRIGPLQYSPEVTLRNRPLLANPALPSYSRTRVSSRVSRRAAVATASTLTLAIATISWALTNAT